ncbi:hypothetical protein [Serinibacter salmoneus]|uniref:Tetratricopeptide repeat protein n=1 Tax=Serinibacter salmoneus TaxID=556530 RepID=A0A2A9D484_9MICO|nr:hypothetical protein [Serinibacter salmoneus]PFG21065.1 hypothetical protein ATL40_2685 [Serinibacter salmoneus]
MSAPMLTDPLGMDEAARRKAEEDALASTRRRRRRLLWWSAPVVAVAVIVAGWLVIASTLTLFGVRAYEGQDYPGAVRDFTTTESMNVSDSWKPAFNAGTARYAAGAFATAATDLERALALVPRAAEGEERGWPECAVATNLALAQEGLGDEALAAQDPDMALSFYGTALTHLEGCRVEQYPADDEASSAQQVTAEDAWIRLQEKIAGAQSEGEGGGAEEPEDSDGQDGDSEDPEGSSEDELENPTEQQAPGEEDPDAELLGELEERNREAQQGREEQEQGFGGGSGGGQGW